MKKHKHKWNQFKCTHFDRFGRITMYSIEYICACGFTKTVDFDECTIEKGETHRIFKPVNGTNKRLVSIRFYKNLDSFKYNERKK